MMEKKKGNLVFSLDFELFWGAPERWDTQQKNDYFLNTRFAIPQILNLFEQYGIRATWATVGFLFFRTKEELETFIPDEKPTYSNEKLDNYKRIEDIGSDEESDKFRFANSIIHQIIPVPGQEVGSHTFSHYYCNESGQTVEQFKADLLSARSTAEELFGIILNSLVFPRNQFNPEYSIAARDCGFKVVRSNPNVWFWKSQSRMAPLYRALDTLIPISKTLAFDIHGSNEFVELPASRFLRPYRKKECLLQPFKKIRIQNEMLHAAQKGLNYHLWFHPHNFGYDTEQNLKYLRSLLEYYKMLSEKYGFGTKNMGDFYNRNRSGG